MSHLVIGARGAQGGAVARRLTADGHRVRGLTRRGAGSVPGVEWVSGDLADADSLRAAFKDVTHASVTLPLVYDDALLDRYTRNLIEGASSAADLRLLVLNITTRLPAVPTSVAPFETRREAAEAVLASGLPTVVLRPPLYLENLCGPWVAPALVRDGVLGYPVPEDLPIAWLGHDDLAAFTAAALARPDLAGTAIDVGGAEAVTGPVLAAAFTEVLGRPVRFASRPVDAFEAGLAEAFGPEAAAAIAGSYRWMAGPGAAGLYAAADPVLDVRPTPLRAWIAGRPWRDLADPGRSLEG
ncbi:NmrA family NAD(P)-binding protein [Thermomonospora umbrina]|uniref:Uncharacterized protein YbjT (DUF2867 family) n=1 Tax=Thermomonospora umbrina TaxID=111806 RepID=A0A3D9T7T9_9ACTN|nr:NmrA family NAD(P)-binding protein [Thermomonospora umbrina]REE99831.1 uncharacterized protein YbjT (DUF2867 family) [Thermomonospora umbrina]